MIFKDFWVLVPSAKVVSALKRLKVKVSWCASLPCITSPTLLHALGLFQIISSLLFLHLTCWENSLTHPMLRLLASEAQGRKIFWKSSKPYHVGIHLKALAEYSLMSTHMPGFQPFSGLLHHFVLVKLVIGSIRVDVLVDYSFCKTIVFSLLFFIAFNIL